jgi:TldD protein
MYECNLVESAYLIENGNISKPLKGATLIGDANDIMNKLPTSSQDLRLASGFCGLVSGSIYVTIGQPHIKVDSITVGVR